MDNKFFVNRTDNNLWNDSATVFNATPVSTSYLLYVFVGSLSVLIMCGNLLVITSIIYFRQLHTPTNYLILSLAVADLLVGVLVLPFSSILAVSSCWYAGNLLCKVRSSFDMFLCTSSILNLCFIAVDRYYAVCQPLRYRTVINVRVIVIMILVSWTVPALSASAIIISTHNRGQLNMKGVFSQNVSIVIILIILGFYLAAITMLSIYLKILVTAQRQARSIHKTACHSTKSGGTVIKMERKATKTLAIVVGIFFICWTPFYICTTFNPLTNYTIPVSVIVIFKWFGWSNSMLNPFVYAFFYSWFRSAFRMIISGKVFQGDFSNSKLF